MNPEIIKAIAVTAALTGTDLTKDQARAFATSLDAYPADAVTAALLRCSHEVKYRFSLADIIERIDDGYPSPEQAWSLIPGSESESAALCGPIQTALAEVSSWIDTDRTGARISFLRRYKELVQQARSMGERPVWVVSLGHGPQGRHIAKVDAQERNAALYGREQYPAIPPPKNVTPLSRGGDAVSGAVDHILTKAEKSEGKAQILKLRDALRRRPK